MRKINTMSLAMILGASLLAAPATAKPSLQTIAAVENGLFSIVVADKIRRECSSLTGRLWKARTQLRSLYDLARSKGYTDAEIDAYVKSDQEKARMRKKRDSFLRRQGVEASQPETYCAVGRKEIQKSSQIGALLKAR